MIPMMIGNMAAGMIAMEYGFKGPNHGVVSACTTGNDRKAVMTLLFDRVHAMADRPFEDIKADQERLPAWLRGAA